MNEHELNGAELNGSTTAGGGIAYTTLDGPSWPLRLQVIDQAAMLEGSAHGWGYQAVIGGVDYSARLTGPMTVRAEENMSALATWQLRPTAGAVDPTAYIGQTAMLTYVWRDETGATEQTVPIWQGVVDTVAIDPATFVLTFTGVDRRDELLAAAPALAGSLWSVGVFDAGADALQQQTDRLSTLCAAFDVLPDGTPALTNWAAKVSPDWAFTATHYVWGSLGLELASHADLVQRVTASFDYRFSRLRVREHRISYDFGGATQLAADDIAPPTVALIDEAIDGTGLYEMEATQYSRMTQQWYEFGGVFYNYPGYEGMALEAYAYLGRRFAQSVDENYTLTIDCAASGIDPRRSRSVRGALQSAFDAQAWEDDTTAAPVLARPYGAVETLQDATSDTATGRTEANNAIAVLLAQGQNIIRASHRNNRVTFATRFNPLLNRTHTASFTAAGVVATGKVYSYQHTLDPDAPPGTLAARTQVTLAISRPTLTVPTPSTLTAPTPPTAPAIDSGVAADYTMALGNHIGAKAASPAWDDETMFGYIVNTPSGSTVSGMITNWGYAGMIASGVVSGGELSAATNPYRITSTTTGAEYVDGEIANPSYVDANAYPMGFRIPVPAIEDTARDNLDVPAAATYLVAIPADTLTLTAP